MAKTTLEYKINIKPQVENLDSLKKSLQSIATKTDIIDDKTIKKINDLLHSIESIQKVLSTKVGPDGLIDLNSFKEIKADLTLITGKVESLKKSMASLLPTDVGTEFSKATEKVDELKKKLADANKEYREIKKG